MSVLPSPIPGKRSGNPALTVVATAAIVAILFYGRDFLVTLFTAVTIGFLLEPFVELLVRFRLPRAVAAFLVCSVSLLLLYLGGLGLYTQASGLMADLPQYSTRINEIVDDVVLRLEAAEHSAIQMLVPRRSRDPQQVQPPEPPAVQPASRQRRSAEPPMPIPDPSPVIQEVRIRPDRTPLVDYVYTRWQTFYHYGLLASFVPFLVYFMLSWRDHFRRSYLQLFHGPDRHAAGRSLQGIADMARAYVVGNFMLGVFISVASGIFFYAIDLRYFLLIAPMSGFLSLVPYVGLPLAMIPPFFAALPDHDNVAHYVVIGAVVAFLHLISLNLLYPKLVGSRVHLNPLAVTVALMFWGTLWGAIGLVFAIPITAGVKAVFDNVPGLQGLGKLLGD